MRTQIVRVALVVVLLGGSAAAQPPPQMARDYLASIAPSAELQAFLDRTVAELSAKDPKLRQAVVGIALIDLRDADKPRLAHHAGDVPIYPASVIKFVYLMAAYAWQEKGTRPIDPEMDALLTHMIYESSNRATQDVVARLTATAPGPALPADAYGDFRDRRLAVKRWLQSLGIEDLHCVNPTYDGDGDLSARDKQFLSDRTVVNRTSTGDGKFSNRNMMTAIGTAQLLALLATDRALTAEDSATVRRRMRRDVAQQPHLIHRLAGGAARLPGLEVFAKSGTWGPIYADAGIVRDASGRQFVLVVFTDASPPYRGDFIADLTYRAAQHLLTAAN